MLGAPLIVVAGGVLSACQLAPVSPAALLVRFVCEPPVGVIVKTSSLPSGSR